MAVTITRVCYCCSLRVACIVIALFCIVTYLYQIIQYGHIMESSGVQTPYAKTGISYTGAVLGVIVDSVFILVNVILLIGIVIYRRQLFLPWIAVAVAMVVKEIIYIMFYLYAWIDGSQYDNLFGSAVLSILNAIVFIFYIVTVRSYYEELKEEDRIGGVIVM